MGSVSSQIRMTLPEGWEDQTVHCFLGPEDSGERPILFLKVDRTPETYELAAYASLRRETTTATLPRAEMLAEDEATLPSGRTCHRFVCRWLHPDGRSLVRRHFCLFLDDLACIFWIDLTKRANKTLAKQLQDVVDTVDIAR